MKARRSTGAPTVRIHLLVVIVAFSAWCGRGDIENRDELSASAHTQALVSAATNSPAALIATDVDSTGVAAGKTAGTFGVSPDGQATYAIPIWVPPGRLGVPWAPLRLRTGRDHCRSLVADGLIVAP